MMMMLTTDSVTEMIKMTTVVAVAEAIVDRCVNENVFGW